MSDLGERPVNGIAPAEAFARFADGQEHLRRWVRRLADQDPVFAEVSMLRPPTDRAFQSSTYLLTGDRELWGAFKERVTGERSVEAATIEALALFGYDQHRRPSAQVRSERYWRPMQIDLMVWASFCWTDQWFDGPTAVPRALTTPLYERWLTALWIHKDHYADPGSR